MQPLNTALLWYGREINGEIVAASLLKFPLKSLCSPMTVGRLIIRKTSTSISSSRVISTSGCCGLTAYNIKQCEDTEGKNDIMHHANV